MKGILKARVRHPIIVNLTDNEEDSIRLSPLGSTGLVDIKEDIVLPKGVVFIKSEDEVEEKVVKKTTTKKEIQNDGE